MARAGLAMRRKAVGEDNLAVAASLANPGRDLAQTSQPETRRKGSRRRRFCARRWHCAGSCRAPGRPMWPTRYTSLGLLLVEQTGRSNRMQREGACPAQAGIGDDDPNCGQLAGPPGRRAEHCRQIGRRRGCGAGKPWRCNQIIDPDNRRVNLTRTSLGENTSR